MNEEKALLLAKAAGAAYSRDYHTVNDKLLVRHYFDEAEREVASYTVPTQCFVRYPVAKKWISAATKYLAPEQPL